MEPDSTETIGLIVVSRQRGKKPDQSRQFSNGHLRGKKKINRSVDICWFGFDLIVFASITFANLLTDHRSPICVATFSARMHLNKQTAAISTSFRWQDDSVFISRTQKCLSIHTRLMNENLSSPLINRSFAGDEAINGNQWKKESFWALNPPLSTSSKNSSSSSSPSCVP